MESVLKTWLTLFSKTCVLEPTSSRGLQPPSINHPLCQQAPSSLPWPPPFGLQTPCLLLKETRSPDSLLHTRAVFSPPPHQPHSGPRRSRTECHILSGERREPGAAAASSKLGLAGAEPNWQQNTSEQKAAAEQRQSVGMEGNMFLTFLI